jgi:hypothetical protein
VHEELSRIVVCGSACRSCCVLSYSPILPVVVTNHDHKTVCRVDEIPKELVVQGIKFQVKFIVLMWPCHFTCLYIDNNFALREFDCLKKFVTTRKSNFMINTQAIIYVKK